MAAKKVTPSKRKSSYQKAISSTSVKAGSSKVKSKPYNKQWMDEGNKKKHAWDKSKVRVIGETALQFSPLGATEPLYRALTGKDLVTKKKTKNRLGDAVSAAALLTPIKGMKVVKAVKKSKQTQNMLSKTGQKTRATGEGAYKGYESAVVAAYLRDQKLAAKRAKTKTKTKRMK